MRNCNEVTLIEKMNDYEYTTTIKGGNLDYEILNGEWKVVTAFSELTNKRETIFTAPNGDVFIAHGKVDTAPTSYFDFDQNHIQNEVVKVASITLVSAGPCATVREKI